MRLKILMSAIVLICFSPGSESNCLPWKFGTIISPLTLTYSSALELFRLYSTLPGILWRWVQAIFAKTNRFWNIDEYKILRLALLQCKLHKNVKSTRIDWLTTVLACLIYLFMLSLFKNSGPLWMDSFLAENQQAGTSYSSWRQRCPQTWTVGHLPLNMLVRCGRGKIVLISQTVQCANAGFFLCYHIYYSVLYMYIHVLYHTKINTPCVMDM